MNYEAIKKYWYQISFALILIFAVFIRFKFLLLNPSFWLDESALGWNILNKTYLELFQKLRFLQIAPPLFLIFSKIIVGIVDGYHHAYRCDIALRILPFLSSVGSIGIFYLVLKQIINSKLAQLFGLVIFAFNPILFNYSFEFKPYSTDILCSLIAIYLFLKIDFKTIDLKTIFKNGIIFAILPWFSFASAFVIFAGFILLSFKKDNPRLFTSLLMPVVVSAFVYLHVFIVNAYVENSVGMINYWQNKFVSADFSNLFALNNENLSYFFSNIPFLPVGIFVIFAIVGAILLFKEKKYSYLCLSVMTLSIAIIASVLKYYPFSTRMILFLLPLFLIYVTKATDVKNKIVSFCLISVLLIPHLVFLGNVITLKTINKNDFARNMMFFMAENIASDEKIIINGASNADFYYYNFFFNLKNEIVYLKPISESPDEINKLLDSLNKGKYWLFMSYDYYNKRANIDNILTWSYKHAQIDYAVYSKKSVLMKIYFH